MFDYKEYYQKTKEKQKAYSRQYYETHKAEKKKNVAEYSKRTNYKYIYKSNKKWKKNNPDKILKYNIKQLERSGSKLGLTKYQYKRTLNSWSLSVRKRDNNQCQTCGDKNNLNAHHIIHKSDYPYLTFNINNGITLCKKCHHEVHYISNYFS